MQSDENIPIKDSERRIREYLECEALMNEFFKEANYCYPNCISQPKSKCPGSNYRGDVGCCWSNFHSFYLPHNEIARSFVKEREKKYGHPKNIEEPFDEHRRPCDYHAETGCSLKEYKPPICIKAVCVDFAKYLKKEFNIDYNKFGNLIFSMFGRILGQEIKQRDICKFKLKINDTIKKVREKKSKKNADNFKKHFARKKFMFNFK